MTEMTNRSPYPTYGCIVLCLLCGLTLACALADQTERANKFVSEMNELVLKGEALARQGAEKEPELQSKDIDKERDEVREIARQQATIYRQGANSFRAGAAKADEARKLRIPDWYKNYLSLKAQQHRKGAEILDAAIERAELLAGEQPVEEIDEKVSLVNERVATLTKEEEELTKQAAKIESDHKADFNP